MKKNLFQVSFDRDFEKVMLLCGKTREHKEGTWINENMIDAYTDLYRLGVAHSVEVWYESELVGGLYGVSLGGMFFGESMFSIMSNASKTALVYLVEKLKKYNFDLIDCQLYTDHLASMGARNIPRNEYLNILRKSLLKRTVEGNWGEVL